METQTIIILDLLLLCGCGPINRYLGIEDDSIVEEMVEEAIQIKTGMNIDLTPNSPE